MKIPRLPIFILLACLSIGPVAVAEEDTERRPDGLASPLPPEILGLLEGMRVSIAGLEAVRRFQADLLDHASVHPELARELRAPMEICLEMLAEQWCRNLVGTFR